MSKVIKIPILILVAAALQIASPARADLIYDTNAGLMNNQSNPIDAQATFTFGANKLTVVLENLQTNYRAADQAVSGIIFQISPAATGMSLTSQSAVKINVANDGTASYLNGISTPVTTGWSTTSNLGLTALTGGQPDELIIGPPTTTSPFKFSNFNGQSQFNPYLLQTATFNFTFTGGVTSGSTVTGVQFEFGTKPDFVTSSNGSQVHLVPPVSTPEPSTIALAISALPLGLVVWRRSRRKARAA